MAHKRMLFWGNEVFYNVMLSDNVRISYNAMVLL